MSSIAIIGPDGAGKTTITQRLVESGMYPLRYIYMGTNVDSCSHILPTTQFASRVKLWLGRRMVEPSAKSGAAAARNASPGLRHGRLWAAARLLNNLAEEWYRQLVSWYYQWDGYVVIYDRHFVFDLLDESRNEGKPPSNRIHDWLLKRFYPRPDLVIFLDAPPEVLYARKPEWPVEELARRRRTLANAEGQVPRFVRMDSALPLETVYRETAKCVAEFCEAQPGAKSKWRLVNVLPDPRDG
jgi:thymidylate kinase